MTEVEVTQPTETFIPDVFTNVFQEQYLRWVSAGRPTTGPDALPAGAIPLMAEALNRLGEGLHVASLNINDLADAIGVIATGGYVHTQSAPAATWTIAHAIGRLPQVEVYLGDVQVDADVTASPTLVTVTFPTPTAGRAVLT